MKKKKLLRRIEALERRVAELEARPNVLYLPYIVPEPSFPLTPIVTWQDTSTTAVQDAGDWSIAKGRL